MNNLWLLFSENFSLIPAVKSSTDIFGFGEYVSALALLIIVYTTTNSVYKFRLTIVPVSIRNISFILLIVIGMGTLLMEVWFSSSWLIPRIISNEDYMQFFFAVLFLIIISFWIYFAFITPPIFSKYNYKKYMDEVYKLIINGSYDDLIMLSSEINRSSNSIIKASSELKTKYLKEKDNSNSLQIKNYLEPDNEFSNTAYNLLLLFANKKFCKQIIITSPVTVIEFIRAIDLMKKYDVPIAQFLTNISIEAILNENSILYSESEKYSLDLIGNDKYFTKILYGNHDILKSLDFLTPFSLGYELGNNLNENQYKIFINVTMITIECYIKKSGVYYNHFRPLNEALEIIKYSSIELYKLNNMENYDAVSLNIHYKKLTITVNFIKDFIELLEKYPSNRYKLRKCHNNDYLPKDIYDVLVDIIFDMIINISNVKLKKNNSWFIHYNVFWSHIFAFTSKNKEVRNIIEYKLRRRLYNEIKKFNSFNNYRSGKILGFMLNILSLNAEKDFINKKWYGFHKILLEWIKINYLTILDKDKKLSKVFLIGFIKYKDKKLLYKTNRSLQILELKE